MRYSTLDLYDNPRAYDWHLLNKSRAYIGTVPMTSSELSEHSDRLVGEREGVRVYEREGDELGFISIAETHPWFNVPLITKAVYSDDLSKVDHRKFYVKLTEVVGEEIMQSIGGEGKEGSLKKATK